MVGWVGGGGSEIIYLSLHCHHQNDSCIKTGSDENHFNVSLIVRDKVTRQRPQTTTFSKRKESLSGIEPRPFSFTADMYILLNVPDAKEHIRDTTADSTAHLGLVEGLKGWRTRGWEPKGRGRGVGAGAEGWGGGGGKRGTKQAAEVPSKDQVFLARPRGKVSPGQSGLISS